MDNEDSLTFPALGLMVKYISAIKSSWLAYTCKDKLEYCGVQSNYQGHARIWQTNNFSTFLSKCGGSLVDTPRD